MTCPAQGMTSCTEDMLMIVGHDHLAEIAGADFLAADDQGDFDFFCSNIGNCGFQQIAFRGAGGITVDRFVNRRRDLEYGVVQQIHVDHLSF